MSLRRPTVAHLLYTFDISPFCDVAQTSDCGTYDFYFQYKPFMWCRLDARLRHCYSFCILSRSHSDTRLALSILLWDFGRTTAQLLLCFPCIVIPMSDCTC